MTTATTTTMTLETKEQIHEAMIALGEAARAAMRELGSVPAEAKNTALREAAKAIRASKPAILAANEKDLAAAKANGTTGALLDRLMLDDSRIEGIDRKSVV